MEDGQAAPTAIKPRRVWSRDRMANGGAGKIGIPRVWDEFLDGEEACFWGLHWEESIIARRMASLPPEALTHPAAAAMMANMKVEPDQDRIAIAYLFLSARGGDTAEFAYDPARRCAPYLLDWKNPEHHHYLKANLPAGRINMLAAQVEKLSVIRVDRITEHLDFFQRVIVYSSSYMTTVIQSLDDHLASCSPEDVELSAGLRLMRTDLTDLNDSALTLLLGSSTPETSSPTSG